jgi:acetyltransferase-like isoleucine patch superfamily enzyme/dTDP-4-dehydrorhamnose 3,5-epimerase-like enzyme
MPPPLQPSQFFRHDTAIVESPSIGRGTRIWAFAHVLPGAVIGADCNICDHTFIENDVHIGDRVTIKCGVHLWDGITIEDDVFIGSNATFTNDPYPRSKRRPRQLARTVVRKGASIGANATLLPGITVGQQAMIGAGAVVTGDVPPLAIVTGNPARIVGYEGAGAPSAAAIAPAPVEAGATQTRVAGVALHRLPQAQDLRGLLTFAEVGEQVPFEVKRYFLVSGVATKEVRGEHAHRKLRQFLVCVQGQCHIVADDGQNRQEFVLDSPALALYLPAMVWGIQYRFSRDAVLLVLVSEKYDSADYIRDYSEFLQLAKALHI